MAADNNYIPDIAGVTTDWYSLRPGVCVRVMSGQWLGRWWWTVAVPVGIFMILGMWDLRFLILALLLLLVIVPGVMAFVYFTYALRPLTASSIFPHRVIFDQHSLTVEYLPMQVNRKQKKQKKQKSDTEEGEIHEPDNEDDTTETIDAPVSVTMPYKDITRAENTGSGLLIQFAADPRDLLYISSDVFASRQQTLAVATAINMIR